MAGWSDHARGGRGDAAVAMPGKKEHLGFPGIRTERPAVAEDDRCAGAPVLVVNLRSIAGRDRTHAETLADDRGLIQLSVLGPDADGSCLGGEAEFGRLESVDLRHGIFRAVEAVEDEFAKKGIADFSRAGNAVLALLIH